MNHQPREDQNKRREVALGPWRLTVALTGTKEDTASREKESKAVCGRSSGQWQREGYRSNNSTRDSMMNSAALAEKNSQYWKAPGVSCVGVRGSVAEQALGVCEALFSLSTLKKFEEGEMASLWVRDLWETWPGYSRRRESKREPGTVEWWSLPGSGGRKGARFTGPEEAFCQKKILPVSSRRCSASGFSGGCGPSSAAHT